MRNGDITLLRLLESVVAECPHDNLMAEAQEEGFSNYRVVNPSTSPSPNMPPKAYETPAELAQAKDILKNT
ncbi:hypothetical protein PROFUN_15471 [Planoprotostelium fungivorum]|uniref:Uncharacterized protein n=1 Tax=Planoprotostelium fungivorum TaxID=1890364 RepID=A0A2P6MUK5_9EUKA|nr:hypothetical protein PROFUN_15471 [Planoprotostelium fungivorum]